MEPEKFGILDKMIAAIQNQLNLGKYDAQAQLFLWGLGVAAEKLDDDALKAQARRVLIAKELADELDRERRHDKRIYAAVRSLGYDESLRIAQEKGLDMEVVKEIIDRSMPKSTDEMGMMDRMSAWLLTVIGDGAEYKVDEVKQMAMEDEILPDESGEEYRKAWDALRATASRSGYCKRRGVWQIQARPRVLDD